jgi:SAM-dependent methyltransferase
MLGPALNSLLKHPRNYIKVQSIIGADRLRHKCIEVIQPGPEDCILDIGCGPAQILEVIPKVKQYYGFDTEKRYIDYALNKYSGRGEFFSCAFDEEFLASKQLDPIDKVFLMGILHHISDETARDLLKLLCKVLKPTGSVVSLDPCFVPNQSPISRFMAKNDRGRFVRNEEEYLSLVKSSFAEVDVKILNNTCRIPSTEIIMHLKMPR